MEYQVVVTPHFEETTAHTIHWLQIEWSRQSADKFKMKLQSVIEKIRNNPGVGRSSTYFTNVRSILVTKHNRIYYKVTGNTITLLELFETRQNPERNLFE